MPCLFCLCSRSPSSKFTQRAAGKSDCSPTKTSKPVHHSESDPRRVDNILADETVTLLSVNNKSSYVGPPRFSHNAVSQANSLQTSDSHMPVKREPEVDSKQGRGTEHSKTFAFHQANQPPHSNDLRIPQKAHSPLSTRPVFIPKAKSSLMMHVASATGMQISTSVPSEKLHMTTNKVSSHSVQEPLSIPNPSDRYSKKDGGSSLDRGLRSDASTSNACETPCAKGQESNSTLSLHQCPLCAVQFESR